MDVPLHDSLDGQVALVTGASRGIGAAIADGLADLGATVYGCARDSADVADRHRGVRLDVTNEADIGAAIDRVRREEEELDVVVNNAAVGGPEAPRTPEEGADTPVWLARFAPGAPSGEFWEDRERIDW